MKPNYKSWEQPEVKAVLGLQLGTWLFQGALECVDPRLPKPPIIELKGAVPKKGPELFRPISDARVGNKSPADRGLQMNSGPG